MHPSAPDPGYQLLCDGGKRGIYGHDPMGDSEASEERTRRRHTMADDGARTSVARRRELVAGRTVALATDLQGRLQHKRCSARWFFEEVLEHGPGASNYLSPPPRSLRSWGLRKPGRSPEFPAIDGADRLIGGFSYEVGVRTRYSLHAWNSPLSASPNFASPYLVSRSRGSCA